MRSFSLAVNVRRRGRSESSGLAAAGAGTTVGLRPSAVPAPAAAIVCALVLGMTTRHSPAPSRVNFRGEFVSPSLAQRGGHRARHARRTCRYPSDLTDAQWGSIQHLFSSYV